MAGNKNLNIAARAKNDEFYTQYDDIERELYHYQKFFAGKVVLCNCDNPYKSDFFRYFTINFSRLKLKKLIATCYASSPIRFDVTEVKNFNGDGDFRLPECVDALNEADIVVTNPSFYLFREYVAQLIHYDKKFLIIGNMNANYDAIEVSGTAEIPKDCHGVMGVPITFLDKYNPDRFEILGKIDGGKIDEYNLANPIINGRKIFKRIAIRRREGSVCL